MGVSHYGLQGLQHRRVQVVVQVGYSRVVTVHGQQILGQVVGTNRQEVHLSRQFLGLVHRCRNLDHHANRRHRHVAAFVANLAPGPVDQVQGFFQLMGAGDHRQQNPQVVQAFTGLEHGAGLHQEDFRVVEGDANAAPAEERVVFLDREVRQRLVATNVQGTHGHWLWVKRGQLLAVDRQLFLFTREALVDHERHFGTVQTDAFGPALLRARDVRQQAGVDPERHAVAIDRDARQIAQRIQPEGQLLFFFDHLGELLAQHVAGVGVDLAAVTVDDHANAVDLGIRQVHQAHHRWNTHGPGKDHNVGVTGAKHRNQAHQLVFRNLAEHGRRQFLADQDGVVGIDQGLLALFLQISEQATTEVLDVRRTLTQVGVVHQFEAVDVIGDHLAQRALGPLPGLDHGGYFAAQRRIVEHHQVDVEQRALFRAQLRGELGGQRTHVRSHTFDGGLEQPQFRFDVNDGLVGHHVQVGRRQHDHRRTDRRAGRARHADELGFLDTLALPAQATDRTGGLGVGDNPGELRAHGHEEGFFAFIELAALFLLDNQHTDDTAVVDDWRPEERSVALFTGFGEVAVARVIRGVFEVQGFFTRADQTHQTFIGRHADLANRALVQALGGHQHKAVGLGVKQVDRADLAAHGLFDAQHNNPQRRLEILGGVNFLDDLAQRIEHGSGSNSVVSRALKGAGQAL
eukprot:Opistho-1_new@10917